MRRALRNIPSLVVLLSLCGALAGCGGGGMSNWDPTDMLDFLDTKKKLPGQRKPVFPEGVPGLQPGVPREYYRGAQAEPEAAPPIAEAPSEPKETKGRKATPKRTAARPAAVQVAPADANVTPDEGEPAAVAEPPPGAKPKLARRRTTAPPPDPAPAPAAASTAAPAASGASPFPAPLPSGTFNR